MRAAPCTGTDGRRRCVQVGNRLLWFTTVKAVINTCMVVAGYKPRGHFKFTPKTGLAGEDADKNHVPGDTVVLSSAESPPSGRNSTPTPHSVGTTGEPKNDEGTPLATNRNADSAAQNGGKKVKVKKPPRVRTYRLHAALSRVTGARKACMPMDGTLDVWVLYLFFALSLFSAVVGVRRLVSRDALYRWNNNGDTLLWIGVIFALVDCTPALLFTGCVSVAAIDLCALTLLRTQSCARAQHHACHLSCMLRHHVW